MYIRPIHPRRSSSAAPSSGIILLVVLGMLTLFSMLGVSYLVYTSHQRAAAFSIHRSETNEVDRKALVMGALGTLLVGTDGPSSSLWGHDILGDLYGMRDGIQAQLPLPQNYPLAPGAPDLSIDCAPAALMGNQFLRFPTTLHVQASYPYRRNEDQEPRRYPGYKGPFVSSPPTTRFPADDMLNGRLLTFLGGPLEGLTFPIVRSFGDHRNAPATNFGRETLSGQILIDIRGHLNSNVTIDNETRTIFEWLTRVSTFDASRFFYDGVVNTAAVSGTSPATPYAEFFINGKILNGPGLGWDLRRTAYDTASAGNFNLNEAISAAFNVTALRNAGTIPLPLPPNINPVSNMPYESSANGMDVNTAIQGHYALYRLDPAFNQFNALQRYISGLPPGDSDEAYDAADYNNLWLSYFPNDPTLGEPTPSFVRPAILNWIVNQQSGGTLTSLPAQRLRNVLYALQRSTLRPLPFQNDPVVPDSIPTRSPGVLQLRYDNFTGGNTSPGLSTVVNMASNSSAYLAARILELSTALAGIDTNGDGIIDSWDVDNDGDGVQDSLWVDAGLALGQDETGKLYKPLVAFKVEDLGGRVNVNFAGNLAQARDAISTLMTGGLQHERTMAGAHTPASPADHAPILVNNTTPPPASAQYTTRDVPSGFGYGPAEIDIRALFAPNAGDLPEVLPGNAGYPAYAAQRRARMLRGPQRLIGERLGVWSLTNGRVPASNVLLANTYIAAGELRDPLTNYGNDLLGAIRNPLDANLQNYVRSQGLPTDAFGRVAIGLDLGGGIAVARGTLPVTHGGGNAGDAYDDPYEFVADASDSPDAPYAYDELEPLLQFDGFDRDLIGSRLLEIIDDYHNTVPGNRAQQDALTALKKLLADSITTHSNSAAVATGLLPSEWHGNTKNLDELRTPAAADLQAATAALGPEQLFIETLNEAIRATSIPVAQRDQYRNALLAELLPMEVRGGSKFNLNRPFGNGVDDNNNGVIDEPSEVASGEVHLRYENAAGNPADTYWSSTRGNVTPGEPFLNSRATFARYLYVMAMFLTRDASATANEDFVFPIDPAVPFTPLAANPRTLEEEYRAWKIAQWAVNVADFRDTDSIMTRFDYDPNPYDGWDVYTTASGPTFRTVWGLEYPELTLEESLAFHDRKVRDTAVDPSGSRVINQPAGTAGTDADPDQYQLPVGSLFLEVRSTRSPQPLRTPTDDADSVANPMAFPRELYRNVGTTTAPDWRLNLAAEAPDQNPVWRVAITHYHDRTDATQNSLVSCPDFLLQPLGADAIGNDNFTATGVALDRDTTTLDPARPQFFGPRRYDPVNPTSIAPIDRVIWFTNRDPDPDDDGIVNIPVPEDSAAPGKIFYNRSGANTTLAPGQIAVIGPRATTSLGTAMFTEDGDPVIDSDGTPLVDVDKFPAKQAINLIGTTGVSIVRMNDTTASRSFANPIFDGATAQDNASARPVVRIIAQSNPPTAWTGMATRDRRIGVNVSEPYEVVAGAASVAIGGTRTYYREPTERLSDRNTPTAYPINTWYNFDTASGQLPDRPFDGQAGAELHATLGPANAQKTGTWNHYKTAYLQRLADPTQAYNADTNPYISVDYIPIDLTVFNGSEDNGEQSAGGLWPDPNDADPYNSAPNERLASRYKTGTMVHVDLTDAGVSALPNLVHSVNTMPPAITAAPVAAPAPGPGNPVSIFRCQINVTADPNTAATAAAALPLAKTHSTTLGWTNQSYGRRWQQENTSPNDALTPFIGLPFESWLSNITWLNRSYVSPDELMWVPTSAPGRIAFEFGDASIPSGLPAGSDPYDDANQSLPATMNESTPRRFDFNQRFPHLFNYLSSNENQFTGANSSPNLWRLLQWVEVPPPYDADVDFITPETNILNGLTEDSSLGVNFNFSTFFDSTAANSYIDANPLSWNLATPRVNRDRSWNDNLGQWQDVTPNSGVTNGFWTNRYIMEPFRPPFSFRDRTYRRGTINLNTIKNGRVYKALMYGFSTDLERNDNTGFGAFANEFVASRRGSTPGNSPVQLLRPTLNGNEVSQTAGVFKPSNSANIRPQVGGATTVEPIQSTRLRADAATPTKPLFQRPTAINETQSFERSVVHNQLGHTRLANLASEQSNVFAVWITVGLFEVDGTTLSVGKELGIDLGETRRAKGFFIIDRSIPVMYRPGELNNALETVVLSRISE